MIVAVFFYEVCLADTRRVVNAETMEHIRLVTNKLESTDSKRGGDVGVDIPSRRASRDDGEKLDMFTFVPDTRRRNPKTVEV